MLTGTVPSTFYSLSSSLEEMGMYNNEFEGDVPPYLAGEELRFYLSGLKPRSPGGSPGEKRLRDSFDIVEEEGAKVEVWKGREGVEVM